MGHMMKYTCLPHVAAPNVHSSVTDQRPAATFKLTKNSAYSVSNVNKSMQECVLIIMGISTVSYYRNLPIVTCSSMKLFGQVSYKVITL